MSVVPKAPLTIVPESAVTRPYLPYARFSDHEVVFGAANTDLVIKHELPMNNSQDVLWQTVRLSCPSAPTVPPVIYEDGASSARPWGPDYIILRCNVANQKATIRLLVKRLNPR